MTPDITKLPPLVQYVITAITAGVALFASEGLIQNGTEKLVAGLAAIFIPVGYLVVVAALHIGHANVTAARIRAGLPTTDQPPAG